MTHTAAFEADDLEPAAAGGSGSRLRETIVQASIVIVIVALGVAMRNTLGFGLALSIVLALASYWALLLVHGLVRRGYDIAELNAELADLADENAELRRLVDRRASRIDEPSLGRLAAGADRFAAPGGAARSAPGGPPKVSPKGVGKVDAPPAAPRPHGAPAPRAPEAADRSVGRTGAAPTADAVAAPQAKSQAQTQARPVLGVPEPVAPRPTGAPPAGSRTPPPSVPPPLPPLGPSAGDRKLMSPRGPQPPVAPAPVASKPAPMAPVAADEPDEAPATASVTPGDPRAQDIAMMQSLIKGLADQINGPNPPVAGRASVEPAMPPMRAVSHREEPEAELETVDAQVGALREAATALRAPENRADAPPAGRDHGILGRLAGAVDAARIDVYLDPILGLDDHKARHYEVSVQLRDEDGVLLDPRDFAGAIAGTGLVPRIDAHAVTQSARLAGQIAARGSTASLFSAVSGESIRDGGFHGALVGALTPDADIASRLVMSVAQSEIRAFGPAHWEALAAMAQSGLRYALVDVVDLDVDFEGLKQYGFDFVRLDAQVFLDGLPAPHGVVPSADLCRYLSQLGFSLIVGRITDERELVKVFGFGALLGQGRLFGAPRPIKVDRGTARTSAA